VSAVSSAEFVGQSFRWQGFKPPVALARIYRRKTGVTSTAQTRRESHVMSAEQAKILSFDIADHIFSVAEAATHLRISKSYLYELAEAKKIKITKQGKRSMVKGGEVRRYIQSL
jgi:excisionase family DNA binding protein